MYWPHFASGSQPTPTNRAVLAVRVPSAKDPLRREFSAEMCRIERWFVRTLRAKIGGMLFERTALSRKPETQVEHELAKLREKDTLTPDLTALRCPSFRVLDGHSKSRSLRTSSRAC